MVTTVLEGPSVGDTLNMVGSILKLVVDCACGRIVSGGGEIVIGPVDAFVGRVAIIVVLFEIMKLRALTLPKVTAEIAVKLVPVITTLVYGRPLVGVKLVILGATKKLVAVVMALLTVL